MILVQIGYSKFEQVHNSKKKKTEKRKRKELYQTDDSL
jgi:hypothetical protein